MFATSITFAADRTLEDESDPTIVFRKIAVSGEPFNEQYVLRRCREFLNRNSGKKLIRYTLVPDEPGATSEWLGCDHCKPYPFWRMQYDAVAKETFPIGEMIVLGENAVVRYRSKSGSVSETVLAGSNPRRILLGTFTGKIVHVGMSGKMSSPRTVWLKLYVAGAGEIASDAGAEYIADFSSQMGVPYASVEFRSDPWFINEIWRPWFPLFEEHRGVPPTDQEFNSTKTLRCVMVERPNGTTTNECSWKGTTRLP
jgi:hypothetical protein